ncbi:phage baseplate assembly protein V [Pseudobacteriovorax antillogorgiicola]|uniref:Phage baseplate assembly protein V n=1 Tax=Pseudobacteriovorax antillogorgiicola TaxID=1513793 RepID=A0A1Y6CPE2_9BACT|nr:phage baseplate assembly protein V [Pseudobacteriovorax antillogorgiicola]TCS51640.1 phage baseplate assembly protein V [Pseudobacteriovorax antillogorgiicola]SMF81621.1 phage baseplate assembly protein V [Pseudobacteriovorax antillogorgiicola]
MQIERELIEIKRRTANAIRPGTIEMVDLRKALAKVKSGNILTDWRPYFTAHSGNRRDWSPPAIGESCLLLAPGGDLSLCFVLRGLYSDAFTPPSDKPAQHVSEFVDGTKLIFDEDESRWSIKTKEIVIDAEKVSITGKKGELIKAISDALAIIAESKTPTMMGPREALEDKTKLPEIKSILDSFLE